MSDRHNDKSTRTLRLLLSIAAAIIVAFAILGIIALPQTDARFVVEGDTVKRVDITGQRLDAAATRIAEQCNRDGHLASTLDDVEDLPEEHMYDAWGRRFRFTHGSANGTSPPLAFPNEFMIWSVGPDGINNTQDDIMAGQRYIASFVTDRNTNG